MAAFVKPGDRVLLKPNLLTGARPGKECRLWISTPRVMKSTFKHLYIRLIKELMSAYVGR
jgi:uncharacterized protein (DUF362 family)